MNNRYFATFPAGAQDIIKEILLSQPGTSIENLYVNMVVFKTDRPYEKIKELPYFNNTFILISKFESKQMQDLEILCDWAMDRDTLIMWLRKELSNKKLLFRFRFFEGSKTESIKRDLLEELTEFITANTKLQYSSTKLDVEITFVKRSEGMSVVGLQYLSKSEELPPGELRPEVAYLMNYLSKPLKTDVFLDPFAGYGSLPKLRAKYFPAKRIIASDRKINLFKETHPTYEKHNEDGFTLNWVNNESIDKIVTDPPWGQFENIPNIEKKYETMFSNFHRVLKPGGTCVILLAKSEFTQNLIEEQTLFEQEHKYEVRIGGQSAIIIVLRKS